MSKAGKAWTADRFRKVDERLRSTEVDFDGEGGLIFYVPPSAKSVMDLAKLEGDESQRALEVVASVLADVVKKEDGSQFMPAESWIELRADTIMGVLQAVTGTAGNA